jgi:hypothetical protein
MLSGGCACPCLKLLPRPLLLGGTQSSSLRTQKTRCSQASLTTPAAAPAVWDGLQVKVLLLLNQTLLLLTRRA